MITRTVKIKLSPTTEHKEILQETLDACNKALNWISDKAWESKQFGKVLLQYLVYYEVREKFAFPSQITLQLKDKVCASYKADKEKKHGFKARILPLNFPRTASFKTENIVSVNTLRGRIRIFMVLGDFQLQYLRDKSWKIRDSELIYQNRNYYLNLVLQKDDAEEFAPNGTLGVDRGITNIATLSTGDKFSGKKIRTIRQRYFKLRKSLQSKGTASTKRKLKKISGQEKRFQKDCNHVISRTIVDIAYKYSWAIVLENLEGIREKDMGRRFNRMLGGWAFYQLQNFIEYKAKAKGVPVIYVEPDYSSQECSNCHHIEKQNRRGESFCCRVCGYFTHADRNGASVISFRASVELPNAVVGNLQIAS